MSEAVAISQTSSGPLSPLAPAKGVALVRAWLLMIAGLVYAMILVGGATRLTGSGLSITQWDPIMGAIPPMSGADWAKAFAQYQAVTEQAKTINADMTLAGFQGIFWWEWSHRLLGRVIGTAFALPLLAFWLTGRTTRKLLPHLLVLLALGGLQGLVGWWMVSSGIDTDRTSVAPERLMFHLCLALFIIAYCFWLWLELGPVRRVAPAGSQRWAMAIIWIVGVQMALGALVAGLHAGRGYIDWPLMGGKLVPDAMWAEGVAPWENEATTQFLHRLTAYTLLGVALWAGWKFRGGDRSLFPLFAGMVSLQAVLGIVTLMNAAPLELALMHQALGVVVLLGATRLVWVTQAKQV